QKSHRTVVEEVYATFTATGSGQAAPYSFTWTGPNGFTASGVTTTVSDAGSYTATVTDVHGCQSTCTAALAVNPNPTCEIGEDSPVCGGTTHSYTSSVSPAGGTVTHNWSISGDGTINGSTTDPAVNVNAGASG